MSKINFNVNVNNGGGGSTTSTDTSSNIVSVIQEMINNIIVNIPTSLPSFGSVSDHLTIPSSWINTSMISSFILSMPIIDLIIYGMFAILILSILYNFMFALVRTMAKMLVIVCIFVVIVVACAKYCENSTDTSSICTHIMYQINASFIAKKIIQK